MQIVFADDRQKPSLGQCTCLKYHVLYPHCLTGLCYVKVLRSFAATDFVLCTTGPTVIVYLTVSYCNTGIQWRPGQGHNVLTEQ